MKQPKVAQGARIAAEWFSNAKFVPLAGAQMKVQVQKLHVSGIVRHVRGDDPVSPKVVRLYIDPDEGWTGTLTRPPGCTCEKLHVEVDPDHVTQADEGVAEGQH